MKFHLISVILILVSSEGFKCLRSTRQTNDSSVFADLPASTAKVLYGSGGYVVAEKFASRVLTYYHKAGDLVFETKNNNSMVHLDEFMKINGDQLKKQKLSFAVVSFSYKPTDKRDQEFCHRQSSEKLRHLIVACRNKIILRELTGEEAKRIEQYKEEQNESKMLFRVAYERNEIRTQSVGLNDFKVARFNSSDGYTTFYVLSTDLRGTQRNMWLSNRLMERSFFVEGLPSGSGVDCYRTGSDLRAFDCVGDIQLREQTKR